MTHLDSTHAGGLSDFPDAEVHVFKREYEAAMSRATFSERRRYLPNRWAHGPKWKIRGEGFDDWYGFTRACETLPDVFLVPLIGHTRGHCGVAVKSEGKWLFHCGDAYFDRTQIEAGSTVPPPGIRLHQKWASVDAEASRVAQSRITEILTRHGAEVSLFCSHDPIEYARLSAIAYGM